MTLEPTFDNAFGSAQSITASAWPALTGQQISLQRLVLQPRAVASTHWHVNADELGYCIVGSVLVTVYGEDARTESFIVSAGQAFFVPAGAAHSIDNVGGSAVELIVGFSSADPDGFNIHRASTAFGLSAPATTSGVEVIASRTSSDAVPASALRATQYRFDVAAMEPPVDSAVGVARVARKQYWPTLDGISFLIADAPDGGAAEPHWHPAAAELGYVSRGRAQLTVMTSDGATETQPVCAGEVYFVPAAHPHLLEPLTDDTTTCMFFDDAAPSTMRFRDVFNPSPPPPLGVTGTVLGDDPPMVP